MNVTRDEALQALKQIDQAGGKVSRFKGYHDGAPHFIIWGLVWIIANAVTQFWSEQSWIAWISCVSVGAVASTVAGFLQTRPKPNDAARTDPRTGRKSGATAVVLFLFILSLMLISRPETEREMGTMISIVFPFMYMLGGIWAGWRLFAIGAATAAAIMFGYFYVHDWFYLWMAVFGGGSLVAGGIWLRTA